MTVTEGQMTDTATLTIPMPRGCRDCYFCGYVGGVTDNYVCSACGAAGLARLYTADPAALGVYDWSRPDCPLRPRPADVSHAEFKAACEAARQRNAEMEAERDPNLKEKVVATFGAMQDQIESQSRHIDDLLKQLADQKDGE